MEVLVLVMMDKKLKYRFKIPDQSVQIDNEGSLLKKLEDVLNYNEYRSCNFHQYFSHEKASFLSTITNSRTCFIEFLHKKRLFCK